LAKDATRAHFHNILVCTIDRQILRVRAGPDRDTVIVASKRYLAVQLFCWLGQIDYVVRTLVYDL
jgi:hypothetical protein